jgi:phosphoglycerol transferase
VRCQGYEIHRFLQRAQTAGFLDNTLVVVVSDHLAMKSEVWTELNAHKRMNFLAILGLDRPTGSIEKQGTMIDVYPTLLEALGLELPDHQAGLGVSLLSDRPTLAETLGLNQLDEYITYDKALARRIWDKPVAIAANGASSN